MCGRSGERDTRDPAFPRPTPALDCFGPLDEHVFHGNVRVGSALSGLDAFDLVDDALAFDDLAKDAIPPAVRARRGMVEEIVVGDVDEELAGRRMRIGRSRHGDGVAVVLQPVVGLVLDCAAGRFLAHSRLEPAALDHEAVDDAVKHRVGVEPGFDVIEEVLGGLGGARRIELDRDDAVIRMKFDHDFYLPGLTATDSIMTGFCGTFWFIPVDVVGTLAIRITTSIPWTTRPNTA